MKRILCVCSTVTVKDLSDLLKETSGLTTDEIKDILQIGARCGGCVLGFSPGVDITLEDALKGLKYK